MHSAVSSGEAKGWNYPRWTLPLCVAIIGCCSMLAVRLSLQASGLLLLVLLLIAMLLTCRPSLPTWCLLYLVSVLIVPPFYPERFGGEVPVFLSHGILVLAGIQVLRHRDQFQWRFEAVSQSGAGFLLALTLSLPFAFWLSGLAAGLSSCLRYLLILQPCFVYVILIGFNLVPTEQAARRILRVLLFFGALSAGYGILDFYLPIPVPHPFADQYIYLLGGSIRRAQGVFYEASSFGNLCAFFLSLCLVTLSSPARKPLRISTIILTLLTGLFTLALFLSYSRGAWANACVTVAIFLWLQRRFRLRLLGSCLLLTAVFLLAVYQISPELVTHFAEGRLEPLLEIWQNPNVATSGRWEAWQRLFEFFAVHPGLLLFGAGYKSISTTNLFGTNLVVDNGYLSLLFETGIVGLLAFSWFLGSLLRALFKVQEGPSPLRRHCAAFLVAFWCGQLVQMLTGDILTYWRNMVVFFAMAACVLQSWSANESAGGRDSRRAADAPISAGHDR